MSENFDLAAFEGMPLDFPRSSYVDILLFLSKLKTAFRLGPLTLDKLALLVDWCSVWSFDCVTNESGFAYISHGKNAQMLRQLDDSCDDYSLEFGLLLGYPYCCCKMIASLGEANIDQFERFIVPNWSFNEEYAIINPTKYFSGEALISHLPCNEKCPASMKIAQQALQVVAQNITHPRFETWVNWLSSIAYPDITPGIDSSDGYSD